MHPNRFLSVFLIAAILTTSGTANAAVFRLDVVPAQSSATVEIELLTPVGNGLDVDDSALAGFVIVETDSASAPIGTARVIDLVLSNTEAISFNICVVELFGCLAAVDIDAGPADIGVNLIVPGPTATVAAGNFVQVSNQVAVTGAIIVDGTGLADGQIPEGMFLLDGIATGDLTGTISEAAGIVDITIMIDAAISEVDMQTGVATNATVASTVVATGVQVQPGDMDCSGTIDAADVPLLAQALLDDVAFDGCALELADVNQDGMRNGRDIASFLSGV